MSYITYTFYPHIDVEAVLKVLEMFLQGKITAQGKLLQQDTFMVSEQDSGVQSRPRERRVFLFEQLVIFSEPLDKKKGFSLPGYTFKNSIKVRGQRHLQDTRFGDTHDGIFCRRSAAWEWTSSLRGNPAARP